MTVRKEERRNVPLDVETRLNHAIIKGQMNVQNFVDYDEHGWG